MTLPSAPKSQQTPPRAKSKSSFRPSFWNQIASYLRRHDPRQDLSSLLSSAATQKTRIEKIQWLSRLVHWHRASRPRESLSRFKFFLQTLWRQPEWAVGVSDLIATLLLETDATTLLTQVELSEHAGLVTDSFRRFFDLFLPPRPRAGDLSYVIDMAFTDDRDLEWIREIPPADWEEFLLILGTSRTLPDPGPRLQQELRGSILQLCVQISSLALHPELRERTARETLSESPFLALSKIAFTFNESGHRQEPLRMEAFAHEILDGAELCRFALRHVHHSIEKQGVSIDLLYRQEALSNLLARLEILTIHLASGAETTLSQALISELLRSHRARRSLLQIYKLNLDLFARKLVDHAGETGEHYITRNRTEYFQMLKSGAGGGLVTVGTTLVKFLIYALKAPLAFEGLFIVVNYSTSFLAMQFLGFSLATKQPSMTAAALASRIHKRMNEAEKSELMSEVARITRSQTIAAIGNVLFVMIGALLLSMVHRALFHTPLLSAGFAEHTLADLDPLHGLSWFYAVQTGFFLWLSSLCAGWVQNWVNTRGLVEAIRLDRRLLAVFGPSKISRLASWVEHNASGIGGNIAIGVFMGSVPIIGKFSGLPIDIRHITLSSGSYVFAILSLPLASIHWTIWALPILGLLGIGFFNFTISFVLALTVATLSRGMPLAWMRVFFRNFAKNVVAHPISFIYPTRASEREGEIKTDGELVSQKDAIQKAR